MNCSAVNCSPANDVAQWGRIALLLLLTCTVHADDKIPKDWNSLSRFIEDHPDDEAANRAFENQLIQLLNNGKLSPGTNSAQILKNLGAATKDVASEKSRRLFYGPLIIDFEKDKLARVIDSRDLSEARMSSVEYFKINDTNKQWKVRSRLINRNRDRSVAYLLAGKNKDLEKDWIQQRIVEAYLDASLGGIKLKDILETFKEFHRSKQFNTKWDVEEHATKRQLSYVAESRLPTGETQVEVGKVVAGFKDVHHIVYTLRDSKSELVAATKKLVEETPLEYAGLDKKLARQFYDEAFKLHQKVDSEDGLQRVIRALQQAILHDDRNPIYHFALSRAYQQNDDAFASWIELRKTVFHFPKHIEGSIRFNRAWADIVQRGFLNVGKKIGAIQKSLGPPDSMQRSRGLTQLRYGYMVVNFVRDELDSWADLRNVQRNLFETDELAINLDPAKWERKEKFANRFSATTRYDPVQEKKPAKPERSKEYVLHFRLINGRQTANAQQYYRTIRDYARARDANRKFHPVTESKDELIFETWQPDAENNNLKLHQLTRVVLGADDIHCFTYQSKVANLTNEQRASWLRTLASFKITPHKRKANKITLDGRRRAAWVLGSTIAFRSIAPVLRTAQSRLDATFRQAKSAAAQFSIELDAPPVTTGQIDEDTQRMQEYLDKVSKDIVQKLEPQHAAIFRISRDVMRLVATYQRCSKKNADIARMLEEDAVILGIPAPRMERLYKLLTQNGSTEAVRAHLGTLQRDLEAMLAK